MKALVLKEYNRFAYEDVADPQISPDDVLIQVKACGICGSDVHGMDGSTGRRRPPIIMGHEAAGVIARVGTDVTDWRTGQRVTVDSTIYCGTCWFCRQGRINLCDNRRVLGVSCDEYRQQGAYAEYVAVPQRILYALPDGLAFEDATMVEPLSIAAHAVARTPVAPNDTALVVGAGMIGLLVVQVLRAEGCESVVAVDIAQEKLDLALELGAHVVLNPDDCDVAEEVRRLTDGRGADVAYELVGFSHTIAMAITGLCKGGALSLVGNFSPSVEMPLVTTVTGEITLHGSCASCGEYPAALDMMASGEVKVAPLISAVAPLGEGAAWLERLYKKETGLMKVVLVP